MEGTREAEKVEKLISYIMDQLILFFLPAMVLLCLFQGTLTFQEGGI